jgi:hypothetical protein
MNLRPRPHPGMAKISLIGIATILMLAGVAAGANSSHSAHEDPFEGPRVDTPIQSMERCHAFHASGD